MPTANPGIGRREGVGVGIETTPGTAVAPANWFRWLDQDLSNKTTPLENDSAMGVISDVNDSEVVTQYASGKIGGKVTGLGIGYLLTGFFGTPVTTGSSPYVHTFKMYDGSTPAPALTVAIARAVDSMRHSYGVIDRLVITIEQGGWLTVEADVNARVGASSTETIAITQTETEFTSKHVVAKIATNVAGLAGAAALSAIKTVITLERDSNLFAPLGTDTLVEFDRLTFKASAEVTLRYTDSQYNTDFLNNAIKAFSLTATNGATSLAFVASRARYRELTRSVGRDDIITQTLGLKFELDTSAAYQLIQPILTNTKTNYTS